MNPEPLPDYLSLPFRGSHIIEASAGTGKTTALTHLYLSAILSGQAVEKILVVTFTEAAAREVRDRIRQVLETARAHLSGGLPADLLPEIGTLCGRYLQSGGEGPGVCENALASFDMAPVHTIHAYCRSLLREFPYALGAPFDLELLTRDEKTRRESAVFLWRELVYGQDPFLAECVGRLFPQGPRSLDDLLREPPSRDMPAPLPESRRRVQDALSLYLERRREFREVLSECAPVLRAEMPEFGERIMALLSVREIPAAGFDRKDEELYRGLERVGRRDGAQALDGLRQSASLLTASLLGMTESLIERRRILGLARREEEGVETFDDMIARVARGVERPEVAERLRERCPVAFIDEFQDTSRDQYEIFRSLYGTSRDGSALFMIGDPKQSIYRFRGADLMAYLEAQKRTEADPDSRRVSLLRNYRSVAEIQGAVNALFGGPAHPFMHEEIRFVPSVPVPSRTRQLVDPEWPDGASFLLFPGETEKENLEDFAVLCAQEIRRLLTDSVTLGGRPLLPSDIAVLVKTRGHADRIAKALDHLSLPYTVPAPGSLFHTREADELYGVLEALDSPWSSARISQALSSRLFGWTAPRIAALWEDPGEGPRIRELFVDASRIWRRQGLRAALDRIFFREGVFGRILSRPLAVGRIFAVLDLIDEKCPAATPQEQMAFFREERRGTFDDREEERLLDSRGEGVRILTFFKSKGLEFPVVFLPFGLHERLRRSAPWEVGNPDDSEVEPEEDTDPAEDLRLLYVGLTRARERVCLGIPQNRIRQAALSYLLGLSEEPPPSKKLLWQFQGMREALHRCLDGLPGVVFPGREFRIRLANGSRTGVNISLSGDGTAGDRPSVARLSRPVPGARGVTSFTALSGGGTRGSRIVWDDPLAGDKADGERGDFFGETGPAGPEFGVAVHGVLERIGPRIVGRSGEEPPTREAVERWAGEILQDMGGEKGEAWEGPVRDLVLRALFSPLALPESPLSLPLVRLFDRRTRFEQFFLMPWSEPGRKPPGEGSAPAGDPAFLQGIIDVSLWVGDRLYLVDYKTNRLPASGTLDPASSDALRTLVEDHRYDLQASLYGRALREHLRLSGTEASFGGFLFLFLRGMDPARPGAGVLRLDPDGRGR